MSVSIFGRIGRDAELRRTSSGDAVCSVPVAVDYGRKGPDGKKPTQWYEATLWGKQAEALAPYLLKGKQVFLTGTDLHIESFSKADGSQGTKLVCRAGEIKFASDGQQQQAAPQQRQQPQRQAPQQSQQAAPPDAFDDSLDIPF
jgi:single-strand DNA-binding protein